jgi:hypothetical protein
MSRSTSSTVSGLTSDEDHDFAQPVEALRQSPFDKLRAHNTGLRKPGHRLALRQAQGA